MTLSVLAVTPDHYHDSLLRLLWLHTGSFYIFATPADEIFSPGSWQLCSFPAPIGEVPMSTSGKGHSMVMIEALDKSCLGPQIGFQHSLALFLWSRESS